MQLNVGANVGAAVVGASVFGIAPYLYVCPNAVAAQRGCNAATPCRGLRQTARRGMALLTQFRFGSLHARSQIFALMRTYSQLRTTSW
jgi:hypothetical protein